MAKRYLTQTDLKNAIIGGAILGGGGGGDMKQGLETGAVAVAYGNLQLWTIDEIDDNDMVVTGGMLGAPSSVNFVVTPADHVRSYEMYIDYTKYDIKGIIGNENGGVATANGWMQAAISGTPLIDAPCNGRAHPTAPMGSMGLAGLEGYVSIQSMCGGDKKTGNYFEGIFKGTMAEVSRIARQVSISAGGGLAMTRNIATGEYVRKNAAIGGISHAIEVGEAWYEGAKTSAENAILNVCEKLNGTIIARGKVNDYRLNMEGGLDIGELFVDSYKLEFLNEYLTASDPDGKRLYTLPDLITTFDVKTGQPVSTAEIKNDQEVVVFATKKENIRLGRGMFDKKLFRDVEIITGFNLVEYAFK